MARIILVQDAVREHGRSFHVDASTFARKIHILEDPAADGDQGGSARDVKDCTRRALGAHRIGHDVVVDAAIDKGHFNAKETSFLQEDRGALRRSVVVHVAVHEEHVRITFDVEPAALPLVRRRVEREPLAAGDVALEQRALDDRVLERLQEHAAARRERRVASDGQPRVV